MAVEMLIYLSAQPSSDMLVILYYCSILVV